MSKEFTDAAASYFGMDPAAVADAHLTTNAEGLTVHFKIRLSDDDMIGIGKRMEERRKPLADLGEWIMQRSTQGGLPSLAEVMANPERFAGHAESKAVQDAMEQASHMYFKDETGTWHPGSSPTKGHP